MSATLSSCCRSAANDDDRECRSRWRPERARSRCAICGSFHVGGRLVENHRQAGSRKVTFTPGGVPAKVDPERHLPGRADVCAVLPAGRNERGAYPLLLWHGGGLTGVTYETTPDGREGWLNYFLRKGFAVYNSDAVERGRAGWAQYPDIFKGEPVFLHHGQSVRALSHRRWPGLLQSRSGQAQADAGQPIPEREATRISSSRTCRAGPPPTTAIDCALISPRSTASVPCIILFHSQAGTFGFKVAQARPDRVKALIAVEPAGVGDSRTRSTC